MKRNKSCLLYANHLSIIALKFFYATAYKQQHEYNWRNIADRALVKAQYMTRNRVRKIF